MVAPENGAPIAPFAGGDRWRLPLPFWVTGAVALAVTWPSPTPAHAGWLAGVGATVLIAVAATLLPWLRWPPAWRAVPALAFYPVVLLLYRGQPDDALLTLALMPIVWLTLHHGARAQTIGLLGLAATMLAAPLVAADGPDPRWRASTVVFLIGCLLSVAGQHLLRRSRAASAALTDAHQRLQSDNDFIGAVLNTSDCLVVVMNRDAVVTYLNRRCAELTGLPADTAIGRSVWDLPLIRPEHQPQARQVVAGMLAGRFPVRVEFDLLAPSGRRHRIAWHNTALLDASGGITHLVATGTDVAEFRNTARIVDGLLRATTEQAIFVIGLDGRFSLFNAGAEQMLGYSAEEAVRSLHASALYVPEELQMRAAELGTTVDSRVVVGAAAEGRAETREWTFVRQDGGRVPVSLTLTGLRDDGELVGYVGVARDISTERQAAHMARTALEHERLAAQRLREVDQIRRDFVATISHELRTPLTSIIGNLEVALDGDVGPLTPRQTKVLSAVDRNARRLYGLVDDLLLLSQIESGRFRLDAAPLCVAEVVAGAVDTVDQQRTARGLTLRVDAAESLTLRGDAKALERLLTNLLSNAVKFTPPGGAVTVAAHRIGETVELSVTDTGVGIPADELPHVFDRFVRSSRSRAQVAQGTGLGLAISKWIVEQHGGSIRIAPGPEHGTVVTVRLPVTGPEPVHPSRAPQPQQLKAQPEPRPAG